MPETVTRQIVCPTCATANRVPIDRIADRGKCGRCGSQLFQAQPVVLTAANFEAHAGRSDIPLLVDFWAPWCAPCTRMAPAFAAVAPELEPEFRLGKLDTEAEPIIANRFGIRSIPTLALLFNGKEIARQSGAVPAGAIAQWARSLPLR
jgi:thioredoxin 2